MNLLRSSAVQGFLVALVIHVAGVGAVFLVSPPEPAHARRYAVVKVRTFKRPEPPPAPEESKPPPAPEEPKPPQEKKELVKKPVKKPPKPIRNPVVRKNPKTPPPQATPPEPKADSEPAKPVTNPELPAPKPRKFTVAMEATVSGGGVAVPTSASGGTWAFGSPDGDPDGKRVLAKPEVPVQGSPEGTGDGPARVAQASEVTRLPELVYQPSEKELEAAYPEAARRDNIEANVYLKILVSDKGFVTRVRIVRPAGQGFDEVAVEWIKKFRYSPAERAGQPVAVWIPWTYKFRLD